MAECTRVWRRYSQGEKLNTLDCVVEGGGGWLGKRGKRSGPGRKEHISKRRYVWSGGSLGRGIKESKAEEDGGNLVKLEEQRRRKGGFGSEKKE